MPQQVQALPIEENPGHRWKESFDFDADGKVDTLSYTYSGGAHCCYRITVDLSRTKERIALPYKVEGGYLGFDLSKPDNFAIKDMDNDGIPEILLKVAEQTETTSTESFIGETVIIDFSERKKKEGYYMTIRLR